MANTDLKLFGDIGISSTGDLTLVSDTDNLKQRIINKLQTIQDLYYFGDFGSVVKSLIDYSGGDVVQQIQQSVEATLLNEEDIASIDAVTVMQSDDSFLIDIEVTAVNNESLSFQTSIEGSA